MTAKENTMTRETSSWWQAFCGTSTPVDVRNIRRVNLASLVWVLAFLASILVMKRFGDDSLAVSSAALFAAVAASVPLVHAYLRFLRETDELTRLIQMQAMAVGFASGLLTILLGGFITRIESFLPDPLVGPVQLTDLLNPAIVMCVAFMATAIVLHRWYSR
jgi:hypothetical protein